MLLVTFPATSSASDIGALRNHLAERLLAAIQGELGAPAT